MRTFLIIGILMICAPLIADSQTHKECLEILKMAKQLKNENKLPDAMYQLDAVSRCDRQRRLLDAQITALRIEINNEILKKDSLVRAKELSVQLEQRKNRFRSSMLYAGLAETAIREKNYNNAWVYLSRAKEDSLCNKVKALMYCFIGKSMSYFGGLTSKSRGSFTCMDISPTSAKMVAATDDSLLNYYEISTGIKLVRSVKFSGIITAMRYNTDGSLLAVSFIERPMVIKSGDAGLIINLINAHTYETITTQKIEGNFCEATDLRFCGPNEEIVVANRCNVMLVNFKETSSIKLCSNSLNKIAFCGGGLFAGCSGNTLVLVKYQSLEKKEISLNSYLAGTQASNQFYSTAAVTVIPHSSKLLVGLISGIVLEYDWQTGQLRSTLMHHSVGINDMIFLEDNIIATCSTDNTICLWTYNKEELIEKIANASFGFFSLRAGNAGALLASLEINKGKNEVNSGKVKLWSFNKKVPYQIDEVISNKFTAPIKEEQPYWNELRAWFYKNYRMKRLGEMATHPVDSSYKKMAAQIPSIDTSQYTLAFDYNNRMMIYTIWSRRMEQVDSNCIYIVFPDGRATRKLCFKAGDQEAIAKISISNDGKLLVLTGLGGEVIVLETENFHRIQNIKYPGPFGITVVSLFSFDSRYLICSGGNSIIVNDMLKRQRADTITTTQMISNCMLTHSFPAIVISDMRDDSYVYLLGDNFEELATIQGLNIFFINMEGNRVFYTKSDQLFFFNIE